MLDAVGPMTYILEEAVKGQLNQKSAIETAQTALRLLGNASVHASRERRKNALKLQLKLNALKLHRAQRGLPKAAPLQDTGGPVAQKTGVEKDSEQSVVLIAPDLPIVLCMLLQTEHLSNLMTSQIINTLLHMGVTHMTQTVAQTQHLIAGRLSLFTANWRVITNDPWVLNCIQGYTIDLVGQPYQTHPPAELKFSQTETESLTAEVQKMLTKQAVSKIPKEHSNKVFLSQLFSVPKKDGSTRPIINLKGLNTFVETVHFKMEGIHVLRDTLKPGDWMTKVDLKDAYFMIPMASHHKPLLRFRWQGQTYQFNCLPFGLSSAPWVLATLRSLGLRVIIYIDDILIMAVSPTVVREHTAGLIFLLENLGFIINHPKSHLTPTQGID